MSSYIRRINEFASLLVDVARTDRDALVVVTGDTGEGKTVFQWHCLVEIARLCNIPFNPVRQLVYDREDFNNLINDCVEFFGVGVDEAVGLFYSRDYHDDQQIALLKKLDRIRYRHLFVFLLIPSLFHIDKHLRDARVRYWVHIHSRIGKGVDGYAHAYVFEREKNCFNQDPWNLSFNRRLFTKGRISTSRNYVGEIIFKDFSAGEAKIYNKIKDLKREIAESAEWMKASARKRRYGRGEKVSSEMKA